MVGAVPTEMSTISCQTRSWWTQRSGNSASEYEDAARIAETPGEQLRIAVADGATNATFSGQWAARLCDDFVAGNLTKAVFAERVVHLGALWRNSIQPGVLPWYAEAKLTRDGSYATFLGLTLDLTTGEYHAMSCGDCLLVHLRIEPAETDNRIVVKTFPFERWDQFGSAPELVGTRPQDGPNAAASLVHESGTVADGDILLAMSDSIGAWFLREYDQGRSPWRWFEPLELADGDRTLFKMVRDLRDSHRLKDDDVTIVSVRIGRAASRQE